MMPFKFRLKKKQYKVVTKNVFVICVELLDNSIVECTLSADSSGYDCLDNVCQRLGLHQQEFFGLRYVSHKSYPRVRWIDLEKPLKKQLDRYAQEAYLYLRVMYYVNDVSILHDEMTRYHYFLQLKSDVMEGRLRCSIEEAIALAGYSLQAEFGDCDPERHTIEYLQDFLLIPKHLVSGEIQLKSILEAVCEQHRQLQGVAQPVAEYYYILEAQQLDGYGQECFLAKEDNSGEALVAASLQGIMVRRSNTDKVIFYRWEDITNLVNHKRMFGVECQQSEDNVSFYFEDSEAARYVWKLCALQHTFFKETLQNYALAAQEFAKEKMDGEVENALNEKPELDSQTSYENENQPNPVNQSHVGPSSEGASNLPNGAPDLQRLRALLPSYRLAPDYETAVKNKYGPMAHAILNPSLPLVPVQQPQIEPGSQNYVPTTPQVYNVDNSHVAPNGENLVQQMQMLQLFKPPPPYPYAKGVDTESSAAVTPTPLAQALNPRIEQSSSPYGSKSQLQANLGENSSLQEPIYQNLLATKASSNRSSNRSLPTEELTVGHGKDAIRQELEKRCQTAQLALEFELVPKRKPGADFTTAAHPDNVLRNRYQDILPYEENRVRLTPTKENRFGYINASHISASLGSTQRFYVATQSPLASTVRDFWQMIWECDVHLVVMLADIPATAQPSPSHVTQSHRTGVAWDGEHSAQYWPIDNPSKIEVGEYLICRELSSQSASHRTSKFQVFNAHLNECRAVWHMEYLNWPDHNSPPDVQSYLNFMEEIGSVRRHAAADIPVGKNRNTPLLVHCGSGVGRTGVTILCDVLLHALDSNMEVDVRRLLTHLRHQRMLTVQTLAQYKLVYAVLLHYLTRSRLI